jgi:hypothetical protein
LVFENTKINESISPNPHINRKERLILALLVLTVSITNGSPQRANKTPPSQPMTVIYSYGAALLHLLLTNAIMRYDVRQFVRQNGDEITYESKDHQANESRRMS